MVNREELKRQCLAKLDDCALQHSSGHQGKLAARYSMRCEDGSMAEIMFEKGPKTSANLWITHKRATGLMLEPGLNFTSSPASSLYATKSANGKPNYGRHSALKSMGELEHADLICFKIKSINELGRILDHLRV